MRRNQELRMIDEDYPKRYKTKRDNSSVWWGEISPVRLLGGHFSCFRRHLCGSPPLRLWSRRQYLPIRGLPRAAQ